MFSHLGTENSQKNSRRSRLRCRVIYLYSLPPPLRAILPNLDGMIVVHTSRLIRWSIIQYCVLLIRIFTVYSQESPSNSVDSPRIIIGTAKACFEALIRIYHRQHGFDIYNDALPLRTRQLRCAKGLRSQGRNMLLCRAIFNQFRVVVEDADI